MIHVVVDVTFPNHPKALAVGDAALGLWLRGLAYTREHELDGLIPKAALKTFPGDARVKARSLLRLLTVGLWYEQGIYYVVDKYAAKGNLTKAQLTAARAQAAERKRKWDSRNAVTNASGTPLRTHSERNGGTLAERVPPYSLSPLGSDLGSDLISEESNGRAEVAAGETPTTQAYQAAYERGIAAGKGSPYAMPENQRGALHQGMRAHGKDPDTGKYHRGPTLLAWIAFEAEQFARWVSAQPADELKFWSGFGPRGWLKFLNEQPVASGPRGVKSAVAGNLAAAIGMGPGGGR